MPKTVFTRTFFGKDDSPRRAHDTIENAIRWMEEGIENGADRAVAWTGAQDRADEIVAERHA